MLKQQEQFMEISKDWINAKRYHTYIPKLQFEEDEDLSNLSLGRIEELIIDARPGSRRATTYAIIALKDFILWANNYDDDVARRLEFSLSKIDRTSLLKRIDEKYGVKQRFISNREYHEILGKISFMEPYNPDYLITLYMAIYEGIYCRDMSVLANLRYSDIDGNIATLYDGDGNSWQIQISDRLKERLKDNSLIVHWYRKTGKSPMVAYPVYSEYADSCFKIESNGTTNPKARTQQKYINMIRRIGNTVGVDVKPSQLYISGILYRMERELKRNGMDLQYAFSKFNRDRTVSRIMSNELQKSHYEITNSNFRETVGGVLISFDD